ncbi:MAG: hypothetical protein H0V56_09970, partial [Chthoniobacterales bacterium]|nr:hypothetical protein [Chthoniobacterales bacterium]
MSAPLLAQEPPVQLLLPSRQLQADSTFEVRFATEMVRPEQIGRPAEVSPLLFAPPLPGTFTWLSTRSGTFTPEGVLPLGTRFIITLRGGLKNAAGKPVTARLKEVAETPPFRIKGTNALGYIASENATVLPRHLILFNADVNAAAAAKFFRYVDAAGSRVEARVEQADDPTKPERQFPRYQSQDRTLLTWGEKPADGPASEAAEWDEEGSGELPPARRNVLYVAPVKPLPPGAEWRLVLERGLPAADKKTVLPFREEIEIGTVRPFQPETVEAGNNRIEGRRITLEFNKSLADDVTVENIGQWIKVEPAPPNLKPKLEDNTVTFRGEFALGTPYRVTINAGLPAQEPTATASTSTHALIFEKIPPRLYFPDFAAHQFAGGGRQLRLISVNVPRVRVSAKLFRGEAVAAAAKAFDRYMEMPDEGGDESYSRVEVEALAGEVIWTKEFEPGGEIDAQQTVPLNWDEVVGANRTGAVLFTAESLDSLGEGGKRVGTQTLLQLTDLGATWKRDRAESHLHVFSLASGKGIAGAELRLVDRELNVLGSAVTTDAQGNARMPREEEARWVFAVTASDAHLIPLSAGESEVPLYRMGVTQQYFDPNDDGRYSRSIFLFTERGVYKPGDTVYLKGYALDPRSGEARVPAGRQLTVRVSDSKEQQVFLGEVTLSEFGSFAQEVVLPGGSLGRYSVQAFGGKGEQLGGSTSFQVQEYRPNAFEIVLPAPPETRGSTQLSLPVTAKYFMGAPLTKAKLTWSLVARDDPFNPEGFSDYAFGNAVYDARLNRALDRVSRFDAQGDVAVDENGRATITTPLPVNTKAPQPRAAKLLTEVTDLNQQTVAESRSFVQHSSDFYFGLRRFENVVPEGAPLPVELIALDPEGEPLEQGARASIRLTQIRWQTNRIATAGDTSEFESKPLLQVLWEKELTTAPGAGDDRKPKRALLEGAVAGGPGEYLLEAIGKDAAGREILTSMVFEVSGEGATDWNYLNPYIIEVVADKESYEPGETATLLLKTPIAGQALVSVERDRVLRSFIVPLSGNAPSVQVPITATDAPNVYVSVLLLRGANDSPRKVKTPEYRVGYANLNVTRAQDKLAVTVKPASASSRPGEKVRVDAEVRDHGGRPMADAEVTLYAVDEGVLSLTGYETPEPLEFFNEARSLGVTTALTLPTLLREDMAAAEFANKGYLVGDGKGGPGVMSGLRKKFVATPFWNATLRSDAAGRVQVEFAAPDSLTRYRIIAVAATRQSQFGVGESAFEINKPIMIESALPAFANLGDKLVLRSVVTNATDEAGEAEVFLELDARARATETSRRVALPARGSVAVDFPVEVVALGDAKWRWAVKFARGGGVAEPMDAVEASVKVKHPAPLIRQVQTSRVEGATAELLRINDPQIVEGTGEVTVSLTNTRVGELRESLRHLLTYPYGCVEQTASSMLPWLTVRELRATLPELAKSDAEIAEAVNGGIRLLMSMQTNDGGLSYWPRGRESMLWGSAYAALALTLAQQQGFAVPATDHMRLMNYLSAQLRGTAEDATGFGLSDRCLTVYSLAVAGRAEPAYHDLLFQKRARLSPEDRALVALAIIASKGPAQMVEQLLGARSSEETYLEQWFGSIARENALHLLAWVQHQQKSPRVDQLAVELFARRSNGHWRTTQGNAWSLVALASYLRNVETGPRESSGTVAWGATTKPFELGGNTPLVASTWTIEPAVARVPMTLAKSGGQVFSQVTVSARPPLAEQPRQDQGFGLARRYAKIGDDGRLSPADDLRVGDRVLVTLEVEVRRRATYVALEDPLPGLLAPINPAFKSQEVLAGEALATAWVSDHHELREDRAMFFVDLLNPGRYTLRYLARVVAAGEAIAPAAKIEEMYHPERFG